MINLLAFNCFAMYPAASVSGWYFSHPKSIYFSVISGSFRSKVNAEKQLNYLISLGYKASYTSINPKGLYRVAYGRLETRNEAANLMSSIKNNGQDAWLLIEN